MEDKIVQIIQAPSNLYSLYKDDEFPNQPMETKVICLGLTELGNVILLDIDDLGHVDDISTVSNFKGIEWK